MAWTNSKIFRAHIADMLGNTAAFDLGGTPDTFKCALFNTTPTPNQDVASASSAFGAGVWAANEVFEAVEWPTGGRPLVSPVVDSSVANTVFFDAADTASAGATADLAAVFGCLIYDDTLTTPVADQGVCYLYFGGSQSVTNGTFTVQYHANGIYRLTI